MAVRRTEVPRCDLQRQPMAHTFQPSIGSSNGTSSVPICACPRMACRPRVGLGSNHPHYTMGLTQIVSTMCCCGTFAEYQKLLTIHTEKFLNAPHVLVPLLSHLASLSAADKLKCPVQLRRLSDQFRSLWR